MSKSRLDDRREVLGTTPADDETLAGKDGIPRACKAGKVKKVPPPAISLDIPAATPATKMTMILQPTGKEDASTAQTCFAKTGVARVHPHTDTRFGNRSSADDQSGQQYLRHG